MSCGQLFQIRQTTPTPPLSARPSCPAIATHTRSAPCTLRLRRPPTLEAHSQTALRTQERSIKCHGGAQVLATAGSAGIDASPELRLLCQVACSCVVAAACVRNVPQLLACWREKSTDGISVTSLVTEISCYSAMIAYMSRSEYSVVVWGSEAACWVQDSSLLVMVAVLRKFNPATTIGLATLWLALQASLFLPSVPIWVLAKFQVLAGLVLGLGARLPQIVLNCRTGHTGNLVAPTFIFNLVANAINGLCAIVLTGDILVIATQAWMFSLNCTVVGQIWATRRKDALATASADTKHPDSGQTSIDEGRVVGRFTYDAEPVPGASPGMA